MVTVEDTGQEVNEHKMNLKTWDKGQNFAALLGPQKFHMEKNLIEFTYNFVPSLWIDRSFVRTEKKINLYFNSHSPSFVLSLVACVYWLKKENQ